MTTDIQLDPEKVRKFVHDILREYQAIQREKVQIRVDAEKRSAELVKRLKALQERCPHIDTSHHPDASGNNGSWDECNHCGKEW